MLCQFLSKTSEKSHFLKGACAYNCAIAKITLSEIALNKVLLLEYTYLLLLSEEEQSNHFSELCIYLSLSLWFQQLLRCNIWLSLCGSEMSRPYTISLPRARSSDAYNLYVYVQLIIDILSKLGWLGWCKVLAHFIQYVNYSIILLSNYNVCGAVHLLVVHLGLARIFALSTCPAPCRNSL